MIFSSVKTINPIHMNLVVGAMAHAELDECDCVRIIEHLGEQDFHKSAMRSSFAIADNAGIKENAPLPWEPVLVMRDTTECPEGIEAGTLKLVGTDEEVIFEVLKTLLEDGAWNIKMSNPYGDGHASRRIAEILCFGS